MQEVDNRKVALEAALAAGMSYFQGDKKAALTKGIEAVTMLLQPAGEVNEEARERQIKIRSSVADVIQFSGCRGMFGSCVMLLLMVSVSLIANAIIATSPLFRL